MDYHYAFREKALSAPRNPEKTMGCPQDPPAELSNMGWTFSAKTQDLRRKTDNSYFIL